MRLNQWLARATGLSRRAADAAISDNRILVNNLPGQLGQLIESTDAVTMDGQPVELAQLRYIALNKPAGYICSRNEQGNAKTIYDLLPPELYELKSVGRLDKDSSGLLVLTNDGDLAQKLTHPSYQKTKRYHLMLNRALTPTNRNQIEAGVTLTDGPSSFGLSGEGKYWTATLHEGRNRQIRRTFDALGYTVIKLHRLSFGPLELGNLTPGKYQLIEMKDLV